MTNIVFVKQNNKNYLFSVPTDVALKKGDRVLCDTMHGEKGGVCATDSFEVDEHALKQIEDKLIPHLFCKEHNYGTIGAQTKYNDVLGRPLFVGDTVDLYWAGIFRGEQAVVQPSDGFAAGKQFIMGIEVYCTDKSGEIEGGYKILKNRSHADVKNGTIVDGVKYIKE